MSEFPDWPEWRYSPFSNHTEEERDAAQARVAALGSAAAVAELLRSHPSVVLRERAAWALGYVRENGEPEYATQLLESDPEMVFDLLRHETNSWVYAGLIEQVVGARDLSPETAKRRVAVVQELVRTGQPSSRRWLTWQVILRGDPDTRAFVEPWLEGVARERLLSEPENSIRYQLAEEILGTGYRMPPGLLEFTNQWAKHVGYKTGYAPPQGGKWPPKDPGFFAGESRPLLAPKRAAPPAAAGAAAAAAAAPARSRSGEATAPAAGSGHVTIEHTKKSIKAQGVLARVLLGAGFIVPFTSVENRFVVAAVMIAAAFVWLQWLKVQRWWEHG
ncbi:MAG: hypothetical protein KC645_14170 [Gemmatimonadetes bacterium]|nr:hypothetical protein [Gemmatimonadota bacterium]